MNSFLKWCLSCLSSVLISVKCIWISWYICWSIIENIWKYQFSSVAQSCLTLCSPMDCSTPGFPALHNLPESAQTHVCWISDAIQLSHRLSSPSPAFNLSQHWGVFQWVSSLLQVAKYWSFSFSLSPSNEYSGLISSWSINTFVGAYHMSALTSP